MNILAILQEACEHVRKLGMTIELMNKNIFRELIFAESFMSSNLPLIIAQLRLASLASNSFHRKVADDLSQRLVISTTLCILLSCQAASFGRNNVLANQEFKCTQCIPLGKKLFLKTCL